MGAVCARTFWILKSLHNISRFGDYSSQCTLLRGINHLLFQLRCSCSRMIVWSTNRLFSCNFWHRLVLTIIESSIAYLDNFLFRLKKKYKKMVLLIWWNDKRNLFSFLCYHVIDVIYYILYVLYVYVSTMLDLGDFVR